LKHVQGHISLTFFSPVNDLGIKYQIEESKN